MRVKLLDIAPKLRNNGGSDLDTFDIPGITNYPQQISQNAGYLISCIANN